MRVKESQVRQVLAGIDLTELEDETGWWETSAGTNFGVQRLRALLDLLDLLDQGGVLVYDMTTGPPGGD